MELTFHIVFFVVGGLFGFGWGVHITEKYRVQPLRKLLDEAIDTMLHTLGTLKDVMGTMGEVDNGMEEIQKMFKKTVAEANQPQATEHGEK